MQPGDPLTFRTTLRPGDLGAIVRLHGLLYAQERGWDATFEAYVAAPLAEFVRHPSPRQCLWFAEHAHQVVGCMAVVEADSARAQLRWFLVDPLARGRGLGTRLLAEAVAFCRQCDYASVLLWTEQSLEAAARLYRAAGFRKVEEKAGHLWGAAVVEERYELVLREDRHAFSNRLTPTK